MSDLAKYSLRRSPCQLNHPSDFATPTLSQNWKKKRLISHHDIAPFVTLNEYQLGATMQIDQPPKHNAFCKKLMPKPMHFKPTYPSINFAL